MFANISEAFKSMMLLGGISLVVSWILTKLALWLLPICGLLDKPDMDRHIHTKVVPRGGGIGMLLAFCGVAGTYFGLLPYLAGVEPDMDAIKLLCPLGILMPLGILDDRFCLRARTKFFFQIAAAVLAWYFGFRIEHCFGATLSVWVGAPLTVFWIVALINAFNMIDGVDGLASGIGIISATCMIIVALVHDRFPIAVMLSVFAFAILGFLYFNWNPARLFMGDTGSMFIGYVLAVSGIALNAQTVSAASIGIPLLACGIPVLDICLAVWRRIIGAPSPTVDALDSPVDSAGEAPESNTFPKRVLRLLARLGTADQKHLHHRLLRHFKNNQKKTVLRIYGLAATLGILGIACCFLPNRNLLLAIIIILGAFSFIINRLAVIELWSSTEKIYHNFQSAKTGMFISYVINPLWDLGCILGAYLFAARGQYISAACLLRYIIIFLIILVFSRSYRVFWNFAVSDDYFRLGYTLGLGFIIARFSDLFITSIHPQRLHSAASGIAISLVILERLFFHYFRNTQIRRHVHSLIDENQVPLNTAIFGVGPMARLYRNILGTDIQRAASEQIVGLIVRDTHFIRSYCFGMKVLGHVDDVEAIIKRYHISKIVIAIEPTPEHLAALTTAAKHLDVVLTNFSWQEAPVKLDDK